MTLKEVESYFKNSYDLSRKTGLSPTVYTYWRKIGYVPLKSQMRIEVMTDGALKADFSDALEKM